MLTLQKYDNKFNYKELFLKVISDNKRELIEIKFLGIKTVYMS